MSQTIKINYKLCKSISGFQIHYLGSISNFISNLNSSWKIHTGKQTILGFNQDLNTITNSGFLLTIESDNFIIDNVILSVVSNTKIIEIPAYIKDNCIYSYNLDTEEICGGLSQFIEEDYKINIYKGICLSYLNNNNIEDLDDNINGWKKVTGDSIIPMNDYEVQLNSYQLKIGHNIVSYPESLHACSLEKAVLPQFIKYIDSIIGERKVAIPLQKKWIGNLSQFEPGKSYYINISNIPKNRRFLEFYFETASLYSFNRSLNKSSDIHTVLLENKNIVDLLSELQIINKLLKLEHIIEANIGIFLPYNNLFVGKNNKAVIKNGKINNTEITIIGKKTELFLKGVVCEPGQIIEDLVWVLFCKMKNNNILKYTLSSIKLRKLFDNKVLDKVIFKDKVSQIF